MPVFARVTKFLSRVIIELYNCLGVRTVSVKTLTALVMKPRRMGFKCYQIIAEVVRSQIFSSLLLRTKTGRSLVTDSWKVLKIDIFSTYSRKYIIFKRILMKIIIRKYNTEYIK